MPSTEKLTPPSADYRRGVGVGYREGLKDGIEVAAKALEETLPGAARTLREIAKRSLQQKGDSHEQR